MNSKKFLNKISIIKADALNIPYDFYSRKKFLIIGNLPYNISTQILSNWCLNNKLTISRMILMFQKKLLKNFSYVNSKEYSRISILSQWKFDIKKVTDVKPNSFFQNQKYIVQFWNLSQKKELKKLKIQKT